jgi:serine/threonine protein kinase
MAQITAIGQPTNDAERQAIGCLRDRLPADYRVIHNFELKQGSQWFEIDIVVIAPHAVYVVDTKGTQGTIHVATGKWHPEGRAPYDSPLPKLRHHAKVLKGMIEGVPPHPERHRLWVEAVVILTAPGAFLNDPQGKDRDSVVALQGCEKYFADPSRLGTQFKPASTVPFAGHILQLITGGGRPVKGLPLLQSWQCVERLASTDVYVEYRAQNAVVSGKSVLVRVYSADPYLPANEREAQKKRIGNAYEALQKLPPHLGIPTGRDFFPTQDGDGYVLVTDDVPGASLRVKLKKTNEPLTIDQKLRIIRDALGALAHCHAHEVIHRAISPATIILGPDGQTRLTDFDFARPGAPREQTVAEELLTQLDDAYLAPEVFIDPIKSSPASDVYAAGVTIYELLTGEKPWKSATEAFTAKYIFPQPVSKLVPGFPDGFDAWLQSLCAEKAFDRPKAREALEELEQLLNPPAPGPQLAAEPEPEEVPLDVKNLQPGTVLDEKYSVERFLGKGSFGVAYKVIDTLGDVPRAIKIITDDRVSVVARMKQEYRTLLRVPDHPRIVKVVDARVLNPGGYPFMVFEYVEGTDIKVLIAERRISLPDAVSMAVQAAEGLAHLHASRVTHGDIKPGNLLWTSEGVKILDFNVSVLAGDPNAKGGGTKRYLPPDLDLTVPENEADRLDRDIYALGITLYEAVTGQYPWAEMKCPPPNTPARDPRELGGFDDLAQKLVEVMLKSIAPKRIDRFTTAAELLNVLRAVTILRQPNPEKEKALSTESLKQLADAGAPAPNTNPFVNYLLTLYSQSQRSNAGTRGLDGMGRKIYVETELDRTLRPAVLKGEFRLVVISGNAGDGKTAFIQQVETDAKRLGATLTPMTTGNGASFTLNGRDFLSNYDGSQDEGEKINDDVLTQFFAPFEGNDPAKWPKDKTRLIAINEGRLVDFLEQNGKKYPCLKSLLARGFKTGQPEDGVAVVNLNLRSVVAGGKEFAPIMVRLLQRLVDAKFWTPCASCDLRNRCYVYHNALTFQDSATGAQAMERLTTLYQLTTLRSKLHITLRDLRSALAYMLVGTRNCAQIHDFYNTGDRNQSQILNGFYFNSWMGGTEKPSTDRLVRLLREADIGISCDAKLDRGFDFRPPDPAPALTEFEGRGKYDRALLKEIHANLPKDIASQKGTARFQRHRDYVTTIRRLHFFECRDASWKSLLPYKAAARMLELIQGKEDPKAAAKEVIKAINRGEGIFDTNRLTGKLALQVRQVDGGTMRSYRVFPAEKFTLTTQTLAEGSPFLENAPNALVLRYDGGKGFQTPPELIINLDVFEMLQRLNQGYRPNVDEIHGYYLSLNVFKNVLMSAPYQEVLLTPTGHHFYSVRRANDGSLEMALREEPVPYGNKT